MLWAVDGDDEMKAGGTSSLCLSEMEMQRVDVPIYKVVVTAGCFTQESSMLYVGPLWERIVAPSVSERLRARASVGDDTAERLVRT